MMLAVSIVCLMMTLGGVHGAAYHGCVSDSAKAMPYCNTSLTLEQRTLDLIQRMTLQELIQVISPPTDSDIDDCPIYTPPIPRLGLPDYMWLTETNTAVASACYDKQHCATTFVSPAMLASSFNRTLWRAKGSVIGTEMRAFNNLDWHRAIDHNSGFYKIGLTGYGPNMNIVRDPRFGRNCEVPSEDPFLSGMYAAEYLLGMQEEDKRGHPKMLAYVKHFTDYTVEENRGNFDANVSLFDFFDSYLPQYEIAFKLGKASGAMCSYNAENGHPSCANGWLLNGIVRQKWNRSDAVITSDCGALYNMHGAPVFAKTDEECAAYALMNGTDIEAGSRLWSSGALVRAIDQGLATKDAVFQSAYRAMYQHMKVGRFDPPELVEWSKIGLDQIGSPAHKQVNFEAALQGLVLLKNENNFLPLKAGIKVAVVGPHSVSQAGLLEDYFGDQICIDGDFDCLPTIGTGIKKINDALGGITLIEKGVDIDSQNESEIAAALSACRQMDVVVLAIGIDSTVEHETLDRTRIDLPGLQLQFAEQVLSLGKPTVLLVLNGGAVALDGLIADPRAIMEAWYPSFEGARAIAATLFGYENRFGKMPLTVYPASFVQQFDMNNMEMAKAPGRTYKYFTEKPLFSFGNGLSYTSFKTNCKIDLSKMSVTCKVSNIGVRDGDEVLMMFHSVSDVIRSQIGSRHPVPLKRLVAFERVSVKSGCSEQVEMTFDQSSLGLINEKGDKIVYGGIHTLSISRDGEHNDSSFDIHVG